MNFGKYDQRIDFVSYNNVPDGYGGTEPTETLVLSTYAHVRQLGSRDSVEASQMLFATTYQAFIQIREGFTPSVAMMAKYRGDVYKIAGVVKRMERTSKEWVVTLIKA